MNIEMHAKDGLTGTVHGVRSIVGIRSDIDAGVAGVAVSQPVRVLMGKNIDTKAAGMEKKKR